MNITRVSRSREAGAKLPPHTLCVTRGTHFGNDVGKCKTSRAAQVAAFEAWIWQPEQAGLRHEFTERVECEGIRHIACWCKAGDQCHGDIWIDVWDNRIVFADMTSSEMNWIKV